MALGIDICLASLSEHVVERGSDFMSIGRVVWCWVSPNGRPLHIQCSSSSRPILKIVTDYEPHGDLCVDLKVRRSKQRDDTMNEMFVDTKGTYTPALEGKLYVIESWLPGCRETGEQFFSPETVGHLQCTILEKKKPRESLKIPCMSTASCGPPMTSSFKGFW